MRLLLVRHGATANNLEARFTGQSDVPLSALGEQQAEAIAARLRGVALDACVTSDLLRARATAEVIARHHPCPLNVDPALREIAMGAWEGRAVAEIAATQPEALARWRADPVRYPPPAGEALADVAARVQAAASGWQARLPEGTVLWVTHGGIISTLLCALLEVDLRRGWQFRRDNAGLSELDLGPDGAVMWRLNDLAHLEGLGGAAERVQVL